MAKLENLTVDQGETIADLARVAEVEFAAVQTYAENLAAGRARLAAALRRLASFGRAIGQPFGAVAPPITSLAVVRNGDVVVAIYVNEAPPA